MTPTFMKKGTVLNNRFGVYKHDDIIGKEYGSKVRIYIYIYISYAFSMIELYWKFCLIDGIFQL
jgi:tRNA A58 N-methylase Trm61